MFLIDGLKSGLRDASYEGLRQIIAASSPTQRMYVAMLLGKAELVADKRSNLLVDLLHDPNEDVQIAAIESVRRLRLTNSDILEVLAKQLIESPSVGVQTAIVRTLGALGARAGLVKEQFAAVVGNDRFPERVRVAAAIILGGLGMQAVAPLCRALTADHCLEVRQIAALALHKVVRESEKTSADADQIIRALRGSARHEKDPWVFERVVEALGELDSAEAEAAIARKKVAPEEITSYLQMSASRSEGKWPEIEEREELGEEYEDRLERIKALLEAKPARTYPAEAARATEVLELTKQHLAARLTPLLNAHLRQHMPETYAEKQAIASWVNSELRERGLAVRCPKTGKPAILIADIRGGDEEVSRIRLEVQDEVGHRQRTLTSTTLPQLELMEAAPRHEGLAGRRPGRR